MKVDQSKLKRAFVSTGIFLVFLLICDAIFYLIKGEMYFSWAFILSMSLLNLFLNYFLEDVKFKDLFKKHKRK